MGLEGLGWVWRAWGGFGRPGIGVDDLWRVRRIWDECREPGLGVEGLRWVWRTWGGLEGLGWASGAWDGCREPGIGVDGQGLKWMAWDG